MSIPSNKSSVSSSGHTPIASAPTSSQGKDAPAVPAQSTTSRTIIPPKLPQLPLLQRPSSDTNADKTTESQFGPLEDKKQLKRAANRRSAQLSRKRKKLFIEELKEENDDLRRKEQILRSIPDLIVVFDSAGKLWFVSHSVCRFLDFSPSDLEGTSFWDRLCDESVRLLKAAFMDALAARKKDKDTAPLGSGVWELRLVDRDGSHKVVTLNGVVHFCGDAPECVCSIRPREHFENHLQQGQVPTREQSCVGQLPPQGSTTQNPIARAGTLTSSSPVSAHYQPLIRNVIKPQQSVISNTSADDASVKIVRGKASTAGGGAVVGAASNGGGVAPQRMASRIAAQISDGDSVVSESASDE